MPPPLTKAELPLTLLLRICRLAAPACPSLKIPPPTPPAAPMDELPLIAQLLIVSPAWSL